MTTPNPFESPLTIDTVAEPELIPIAHAVLNNEELGADRFYTIATYKIETTAYVALQHLERAGFHPILADRLTSQMNMLMNGALGWVKLQVPGPEAIAARRCLEETPGLLWQKHTPTVADNTCLACGAAMSETADTCTECGWSFATDDDSESEQEPENPDDFS